MCIRDSIVTLSNSSNRLWANVDIAAGRAAADGTAQVAPGTAPSPSAAENTETETAPDSADALHRALVRVGRWVADELRAGRSIEARALFDRANVEVGGSQAAGAYLSLIHI